MVMNWSRNRSIINRDVEKYLMRTGAKNGGCAKKKDKSRQIVKEAAKVHLGLQYLKWRPLPINTEHFYKF